MTTKQEPVDIGSWPAVEATIECCRLVLPSSDYSRTLLCNVGCMTVSPSLEYPTTDVRYVVSASAFRRLTHLSSEKRHPPLPAYQLDLLAMSLWGIRREEAGRWVFCVWRAHSHTHAHTHTYTCNTHNICALTHTCVHMHPHTFVHTCTHLHTHTHFCTHTLTQTFAHVQTHTVPRCCSMLGAVM